MICKYCKNINNFDENNICKSCGALYQPSENNIKQNYEILDSEFHDFDINYFYKGSKLTKLK